MNEQPTNTAPTRRRNDSRAREDAIVECASRHEPLAEAEVKEADPARVLVSVTSIRTRLLDEDNLSEKAHVDCCRYAGLLAGDGPHQVKIETSQKKAAKGEQERTIISLIPIP